MNAPARRPDDVGRYSRRLQLLERKVGALRAGTGHPDVIQLQAGIHELINEMERLQKPRKCREEFLGRARQLLTLLPARQRAHRRVMTTMSHAREVSSANIEASLRKRLKEVGAELGKLLTERNSRLRAGLTPPSDIKERERALEEQLSSLEEEGAKSPIIESRHGGFFAKIAQYRKLLHKHPRPRKPGKLLVLRIARSSSSEKSTRDRYRESIELDKFTREADRSVRTVSGGLPGLGKRRKR